MRLQSLATLIIVVSSFSPLTAWAEDSVVAASQDGMSAFTYEHQEIRPDITISQEAMTKEAIKQKVMTLRQERMSTMPYLDKGFVREVIDKERVTKGIAFSGPGDQKSLQELVARAVESHTPIMAAQERIALAQRRFLVAIREMFPAASFEYEDREGLLQSGDFNARGYHFELRQPIFRGGTLWNTMLQERAQLQAAKKEYDRLTADIIRDISTAYFEYNRALLVSADQNDVLERMKRFASISEQKFKEELISEIEHLNVQSLFSQLKYDFETAKQELELSQLDMQSYLDLLEDQDIEVAPLYDVQTLLEKTRSEEPSMTLEGGMEGSVSGAELPELQTLVDLAYQNRAELQVESARLTAARLRERAQMGELLPHADIVLEMGRLGEAFDVNDVHPELRKEYRLSLELKWNTWGNTVEYTYDNDQNAPSVTQFLSNSGTETRTNTFKVNLLDGLDAFSQIKEAEAEKLEQIVELENAEKEVIQDLKQSYFEYQKALIQVKSAVKRLDYRERLVQLSKHRLEQNEIEVSEYIQAEIDLVQEKVELHKALKDYFTAKAALNRAVGIQNYLPIEEFYGE